MKTIVFHFVNQVIGTPNLTENELNKLLELSCQNDNELHVKQVGNKITVINDNSLSSLGTFKNKVLEDLKNAKYDDLEDMVYRMRLTNDEVLDELDLN